MKNRKNETQKIRPDWYKPHTMSEVFFYRDGNKNVPVEWEFSIRCDNCASDWIKKDGHPNGRSGQVYQCNNCGRYFQYNKRFKICKRLLKIAVMLTDDCSQGEIARELKVHSATVKNYINKYYLHDIIHRPGFMMQEIEFPTSMNKRDTARENFLILSEYVKVLMNYYEYDLCDFLWDCDWQAINSNIDKVTVRL